MSRTVTPGASHPPTDPLCRRAQRRPKHLVPGDAWPLVAWLGSSLSSLPTGNAGPFLLMADRPPGSPGIVGKWQKKPEAMIPVGQKVTVSPGVGAQYWWVGRCQPTLTLVVYRVMPVTDSAEATQPLEGAWMAPLMAASEI